MPLDNKTQQIYTTLQRGGAEVGTEQEFNDYFFANGKQGYQNRYEVWKALKDGGADVGKNYEEFRDWLGLHATKPAAPRQAAVAQERRQQQKQMFLNTPTTSARQQTAQAQRGGTSKASAALRGGQQKKAQPTQPTWKLGEVDTRPAYLRTQEEYEIQQGQDAEQNSNQNNPHVQAAIARGREAQEARADRKATEKAKRYNVRSVDQARQVARMEDLNAGLQGDTEAAQRAGLDKATEQLRDEYEYLSETGEQLKSPAELPWNSYHQRVDANGNPMFDKKGYPIMTGEGVWESPTLARDEEGNLMYGPDGKPLIGTTTDESRVGAHIGMEQAVYEGEMTKALRERERIERELKEQDKTGMTTRSYMSMYNPDMNQTDPERASLLAALHENDDRIRGLQLEMNGGADGFWDGVIYAASDPTTWSLGMADTNDLVSMLKASEKVKRGEQLTENEKRMLDATIANQEVQSRLSDDSTMLFRAGQQLGNMAPFMAQIALTSGYSGVAELGTKAGVKAMTRFARKYGVDTFKKRAAAIILRNTGVAAGDIMAGAASANTTGIFNTANDILQRRIGQVGYDENGNYEFTNDESWISAFLKGEISQTKEFATERFGEHLPSMGDISRWFAKRSVTAGKISRALSGMAGRDAATKTADFLRKMGINGMFGEIIEEEVGLPVDVMIGDMTWEEALSGKVQGDIIGGMMLTVGGMHAIGTLGNKAYNTTQYYRFKRKADKAGAKAYATMGDAWTPLKERIDGTTNEDMGKIWDEVRDDKDMTNAQKKSALRYINSLMQARGYNLGMVYGAREAEEHPELRPTAKAEGAESGQEEPTVVVPTIEESVQNTEMEAKDAGYNIEGKDRHVAYEELEQTRKAAALALGMSENTDVAEVLGMDGTNDAAIVGEMLRRNEDNRHAAEALLNYVKARWAYDGVMERVNDDVDAAVEAAHEEVNQNTNKQSGMLQQVTLKAKNGEDVGEQVYVIDGEVQMLEDGSGVDKTKSQKDIIIRDSKGEVRFADIDEIASVAAPVDAEQVKQAEGAKIEQQMVDNASREIEGLPMYEANDVVELGNGERVVVTGVEETEDGKVVTMQVQTEEGVQPLQMKQEDLDGNVSKVERGGEVVYDKTSAPEVVAPAETATPAAEVAAPAAETTTPVTTPAAETSAAPIQHNNEQVSAMAKIPTAKDGKGQTIVDKKGQPIYEWHKASVADTADAITEQVGGEVADAIAIANAQAKKADEELKKAQNAEVTEGDPLEMAAQMRANRARANEAQQVVDHWKNVVAELERRAQEPAVAPEVAAQPTQGSVELTTPTDSAVAPVTPTEETEQEAPRMRAADTTSEESEVIPAEEESGTKEETPEEVADTKSETTAEEDTNKPKPWGEREEKRRKKLRAHAEKWTKGTTIKVHLVESIDEISDPKVLKAIKDGQIVRGWQDPNTGEAYLYLPYIENKKQLDRTFLHEVVAHKGLRELLGKEEFDKLCDKVYESMSDEQRREWKRYYGVRGIKDPLEKQRAAADEYMAHLAEDTDINPTLWNKFLEWVKEILGRTKELDGDISNAEIADMLRESYRNLARRNEQKLKDDAIKASTGEMEGGGETRMSVSAIMEGAGLEVFTYDEQGNQSPLTDREGNVIAMLDGRTYDGNHLLTVEDLEQADSTWNLLCDMALEAKSATRKQIDEMNKRYVDIVNTFLVTGLAENGGAENLGDRWLWLGETIFKTIAKNGDAQYSYSSDVTRVCKKNEAMIKAIGDLQKKLGYGITPAQIMDLYQETYDRGFQVPCPVCYVFSRYIRNGKYATAAIRGMRTYGEHLPGGSGETWTAAQWKKEWDKLKVWEQEHAKELKQASDLLDSIPDRIDELAKKRFFASAAKKKEIDAEINKLDTQYRAAMNLYSQQSLSNWIKNYPCQAKGNGDDLKFEMRSDAQYPKDINDYEECALDLRKTAITKGRYPGIQRLRNSGGSAGGKEITFASNNEIGEFLSGIGNNNAEKAVNVFSTATSATTPKAKAKAMRAARNRFKAAYLYAQQQSLRGGQRMWSWSDNLENLMPDIAINLMQLELVGGALQTYSKQLEGINLVAQMGGYVNGSLMAKDNGWVELQESDTEIIDGVRVLKRAIREDIEEPTTKGIVPRKRILAEEHAPVIEIDGKYYTLLMDDIIGVDFYGRDEDGKHKKGLKDLNNELDKAGNIIVGMNDIHVRVCMADPRIFFIIPWHASGQSVHILRQMLDVLGTDLRHFVSTDYTKMQEEKDYTKRTDGVLPKVPAKVVEIWDNHNLYKKDPAKYPCALGDIKSGENGKVSAGQLEYRQLREAIFDGSIFSDKKKLKKAMSDVFLSQVIRKMKERGLQKMTKKDNEFVYPYEYWDESSTYDNADTNGARYAEYCRRLGIMPKFSGKFDGEKWTDEGNFIDDPGYWKLLIDRRMYDTKGKFQDLTPIDAEGFSTELVDTDKNNEKFHISQVAEAGAIDSITNAVREKEKQRMSGDEVQVDYTMDGKKALQQFDKVSRLSVEEDKEITQGFGSADTSLNQVPAGMKKIDWKEGITNVDIGGGRFDKATEYLREQGVENLVFDPFNRDAEHNKSVAERVRDEKVDTATCHNVLNVIDNEGARANVILQAAKAIKPDGTAYFTVYEGNKTGVGRQTKKDSWQNNRETKSYIPEVEKYFGDVQVKNNVIIARKPKATDDESVWDFDGTYQGNDVRFSVTPDDNEKPSEEKTKVIFDTAKKKFGTTRDIREAGYVLPDGTMLDFSGRHELLGADDSGISGRRTSDHRAIGSISYVYDKDGNEVETGVETDMPDFIERGAIRIDNNAGTINLIVKPTQEQRDVLARLIRNNGGDVTIDFGNGWDTYHSVDYYGAKYPRILNDISRYFDEGIRPEGNQPRFSIAEREELNKLDKASQFISDVLQNNTRQKHAKVELPEFVNKKAEREIGHKIKSHSINANEIVHSKKRHGINGTALGENSIPLRDSDFALMPYIMASPTRVKKGTRAVNGTESVRYEKDISDGNVIVVEREGKFDVEDMENITMWAEKKPATYVTVAPRASHSTSETIVISEADIAKIKHDAEFAFAKVRKKSDNLQKNQSENAIQNRKQAQFDVILRQNPKNPELNHTWIESVDDIKTFDEAFEGYDINEDLTPDYTSEMAKKAKKTGKVAVYSSHEIADGAFVTPSKMEAQNYAGEGKVYSKTVPVDDVAWIDPLQGQYAKVDGTQPRFSLGDNNETFDERQKRAVREKGVVTPGLSDVSVKIVAIPKHSYTGNIAEATEQAKRSAKSKFAPNGEPKPQHYNNYGKKFDYIISGRAISESLNPKQQGKSTNKGAHLAMAEHLDKIIGNSIEVEEHPDYLKNEKGDRDGNIINSNALMHRFYGVVDIEGESYRVMTLMREDKIPKNKDGLYAYEVQKIEVLNDKTQSTPNGEDSTEVNTSTYPLAKLLENVEKSKDPGKKLLDESVKLTNVGKNVQEKAIQSRKQAQSDIRFSVSSTPFYSNAEKAVEGIKQEKATPEQWLKMIEKNGGLKAGEDKWMGLSDWLNQRKTAGHGGSITKQEVLDFIRENQIQVEEVNYADTKQRAEEESDQIGQILGIPIESDSWLRGHYGLHRNEYGNMELGVSGNQRLVKDTWDAINEKFGRENYESEREFREMLANMVESDLGTARSIDPTRLKYTTKGLDNKKEIALVVPTVESWNQSDDVHFGDAGNGRAVAWVRFGETTDADGKKVLVIDEIQSKRHQEGRERGYKDESKVDNLKQEYKEAQNALKEAYNKADKFRDEDGNLMDDAEGYDDAMQEIDNASMRMRELEEELRLARRSYDDAIPDAPFEKNWHELAMKRMLRYAAENGYDKVAWTKGEQQAERYNLAKTIPSITRQDTKKAADKGIKVFAMDINGEPEKIFVDNDGIITNTTMLMDDVSGKPLSDFVGKEIAIRMMSMNDGETIDTSKEKVGGEGMKGFYDQMLPRFMDKYGKKWGVKTGEVELPNVEEAGRKMWAVDVTPEMKESVMQGQPMFRVAEEFDDGQELKIERTPDGYRVEGVHADYDTPEQLLDAFRDRHEAYVARMSEDGTTITVEPWSKYLGEPSKKGKAGEKQKEYQERKTRNAQEAVQTLADKLGLNVEVKMDTDGLEGRRGKVKGMYDPKTGKITVVLPNHTSQQDVMRTILHEGVGHHGLRRLFGDSFNDFLRNVYDNATPEVRARINRTLGKHGFDNLKATEEYLSVLAEDTAFDDAVNRNWWSKVKAFFLDMLAKAGIKLDRALTDNELRYILWRSYKNIEEERAGNVERRKPQGEKKAADVVPMGRKNMTPNEERQIVADEQGGVARRDAIDTAHDIAMQYRLGVGNFQRDGAQDGGDPNGGVRFSVDEQEEKEKWERKYDDDLEAWKKDNGIAADADGLRVKPTLGTQGVIAYAKELADWNREKAIWDTAPDKEDYLKQAEYEASRKGEEEEAVAHPGSDVKQLQAWRAALRSLMQAARKQKRYDRDTVKAIATLAREYLRMGYGDNMKRGDVGRLLAAIKNATGAKNVRKHLDTIMDIMIDNQLRNLEASLKKVSSVKDVKKNAVGVSVQGKLDVKGQRTMKAYRDWRERTVDELEARVSELQNKIAERPEDVGMLEDELQGVMLAMQYVRNVKAKKAEITDLKNEREDAVREFESSGRSREAQKALLESIDNAIMETKLEMIGEYGRLLGEMNGALGEAVEGAKEFKKREEERIENIHHMANSDTKGMNSNVFRPTNEKTKMQKLGEKSFVRFILSSLPTFEQMLKQFGRSNSTGKGYLYNYFMEKYTKASEADWNGQKEAKQKLDDKVKEVFGRKPRYGNKKGKMRTFKLKRWSDLYELERHLPTMDVEITDANGPHTVTLTQGNLLYIYMANKMSDGEMKLRKMGITEEQVALIKEFIDPRLVELGDWLQEELLPSLRSKYNAVHERLFGAPMAEIDNYFPLRVKDDARHANVDINKDENADGLPTTVTGSIINRTKNTTALDILGTDALSVAVEHIEEMERWAAFAEYCKDINTLLSYKTFRNKVKNMTTIYGSGDQLWKAFMDVAKISAGTYRPKIGKHSLDRLTSNIVKGVTQGCLSFRFYTAAKQLLSIPAFLHDVNLADFTKNAINVKGSVKWAKENLPLLQKRWESRQIGDTRLMETNSDYDWWTKKWVKNLSSWGMWANAAVDLYACAIGARSIYNSLYAKYKRYGYDEARAREKALIGAEIGFNLTQQSSEGAFVSAIQVDRTTLANIFTLFRNSPFSYNRQSVDAVRNLKHRYADKNYKQESIEFMTQQYMRDGLSEEQARKAAEEDYNNSHWHEWVKAMIMMFGVTFLWNMGPSIIYQFAGDDDDKKKNMLIDAAMKAMLAGPIEGLTGGSIVSDIVGTVVTHDGVDTKGLRNYDIQPLPFLSDLNSLVNEAGYDKVSAWQDLINIVVQTNIGLNPETLFSIVYGLYDISNHNLDVATETGMFIMNLMNMPSETARNMYIDELGLRGDQAQQKSYEELAKRYVDRKFYKENPLSGWFFSKFDEEAVQKRKESMTKSFEKQVKERMELLTDNELSNIMRKSDSVTLKEMAEKILTARITELSDDELMKMYQDGNSPVHDVVRKEMKDRMSEVSTQRLDGLFGATDNDSVKNMVGQAIGKAMGQKDTYGMKQRTEYGEVYQHLRTTDDLYEDMALADAKNKAKAAGDKDREKAIERERRIITDIKRGLEDEGKNPDEVMKEVRDYRRQVIDAYGIKVKR